MKRRLLLSLVVMAIAVSFSALGMAQGSVVTIKSEHNFGQTVSKVKSATSQNGLMVMGHLNSGRMHSMTRLHLKAESFLVGNLNLGKKLLNADCSVGLSIPPRIFV